MDIKLDFVPPSLINFISRQLLGSGYKLYQKAVGSVATSDDEYCQALEEPMYVRIREGLDSHNKSKTSLMGTIEEKPTGLVPGEHTVKSTVETTIAADNSFVSEIVEEETEQNQNLELERVGSAPVTNAITDQKHIVKAKAFIGPEVEHALGILDGAIAILRNQHSNIQINHSSADQELPFSETTDDAGSISDGNAIEISSKMDKPSSSSEAKLLAKNSRDDSVEPFSLSKERSATLGNMEAVHFSVSSHSKLMESKVTMSEPPALERTRRVCDEVSFKTNGFHENGYHEGMLQRNRKKKSWFCCLTSMMSREDMQ